MSAIKTFRKQKGLSQQDFAKKLDVTQGAVSQWELGLTKPKVDQLPKIASILDVSVDELLREV